MKIITPSDFDVEFDAVGPKVSLRVLPSLYQDGVTGAIGATAKQYLQVRRATSNQIVAVNQDVILNSLVLANGIAFNLATGVATLTAGKTYRLTLALHLSNFSATAGWLRFNLVDGANAVLGGGPPLEARPVTGTTALFSPAYLDLIYVPVSNQTVKVRCVASSGANCQVRFDAYSGITIQEI